MNDFLREIDSAFIGLAIFFILIYFGLDIKTIVLSAIWISILLTMTKKIIGD